MDIPKIPPGNIFSGDKLRAVFTNPTEIAHWKGNLKKHWPIKFRGRAFKDAEAAYFAFATSVKDRYGLCTEVIVAKLTQSSVLAETLKISGGENWIQECSHHVYDKCPYWEGDGVESGFIRCLMKAYKEVCTVLGEKTFDL